MRVVFWGGPMHDQVLDVPDRLDVVRVMPEYADRALFGDPPLRATSARPIEYRVVRCFDPDRSLARRRGDPPTWPVYVPAWADDDAIGRWSAAASRPVVDGPRSALRVLVDRDTRRQDRVRAAARVRDRGPLP